MSLTSRQGRDGYYDDQGHWQRTKFCLVPCRWCTCGPPKGRWYAREHDKHIDPARATGEGMPEGSSDNG